MDFAGRAGREMTRDLGKVRLELAHGEQIARITLAAPKANIVDQAMMEGLESAFEAVSTRRHLKAIVLAAEGPHFSFGASVQEHLPDQIVETLPRLHAVIRKIAEAPAPTIAAIRGQCLGGGFELVLACDLVLAEETAQLGCPEIQLGVFPPAASAILPVRTGSAVAARLLLTGASIKATEAAGFGLVTRTAAPGQLEVVLEEWLATDFLGRSASALRYSALAVRRGLFHALQQELPEMERMYLQELMSGPDAVEGIRAFLEKRAPRWSDAGVTA